jgi:rhodanese-related sulfurtransferase
MVLYNGKKNSHVSLDTLRRFSMRRTAIVFVGLLAVAAVAYGHTDVSPADVKTMMDAGGPLTIVDVREESEYCDSTSSPPGHIPGAINMPWYSGYLEEHYGELPLDEDIVVVCRSGGRSNQAANYLDGVGFTRVFDMLGGMNAWPYETVLCCVASVDGQPIEYVGIGLASANPNPFSGATEIAYTVPPGAAGLRLDIHDACGRLVKTLVEGRRSAGTHQASWDGAGLNGEEVPPGVYFSRLAVDGSAKTCKIVKLN